jgi:hypothetical protein
VYRVLAPAQLEVARRPRNFSKCRARAIHLRWTMGNRFRGAGGRSTTTTNRTKGWLPHSTRRFGSAAVGEAFAGARNARRSWALASMAGPLRAAGSPPQRRGGPAVPRLHELCNLVRPTPDLLVVPSSLPGNAPPSTNTVSAGRAETHVRPKTRPELIANFVPGLVTGPRPRVAGQRMADVCYAQVLLTRAGPTPGPSETNRVPDGVPECPSHPLGTTPYSSATKSIDTLMEADHP